MSCAMPVSDETGTIMPANMRRRQHGQDGGAEQRRDLRAREGRDQHAVSRGRRDIDQRAEQQRGKLPLSGTLKTNIAISSMNDEIDHRHRDIGQLLAEQELERA